MKTIFVNGTFDLLHPGHVSLLTWAKSLGDYLIVGIDTDDRVEKRKVLLDQYIIKLIEELC